MNKNREYEIRINVVGYPKERRIIDKSINQCFVRMLNYLQGDNPFWEWVVDTNEPDRYALEKSGYDYDEIILDWNQDETSTTDDNEDDFVGWLKRTKNIDIEELIMNLTDEDYYTIAKREANRSIEICYCSINKIHYLGYTYEEITADDFNDDGSLKITDNDNLESYEEDDYWADELEEYKEKEKETMKKIQEED